MTITEVEGGNKTSKTFVLDDEGHTLGALLQSIISRYNDVNFCAYTVPHPSEKKMHLRIQTRGPLAIDILKRAFIDLEQVFEVISDQFKNEVNQSKNSQ